MYANDFCINIIETAVSLLMLDKFTIRKPLQMLLKLIKIFKAETKRKYLPLQKSMTLLQMDSSLSSVIVIVVTNTFNMI